MENIPDTPEGIIFESILEGFEHINGYNKLKSELKQSIQCNKQVGNLMMITDLFVN